MLVQRGGVGLTHPAANVVGQQVGWFAGVLGAAQGHPFLGAAVALIIVGLHLRAVPDPSQELRLLALAAVLGPTIESGLQAFGILTYASPWQAVPWLCPPWIAVLWIQFGTTLRFGFFGSGAAQRWRRSSARSGGRSRFGPGKPSAPSGLPRTAGSAIWRWPWPGAPPFRS